MFSQTSVCVHVFELDFFLSDFDYFLGANFDHLENREQSQEIVFFLVFKYWLDSGRGSIIKLTAVIKPPFIRSLLSLHLTWDCLPLFLGATWQGAIWLCQLYLGRAWHESDVLFLLEGKMCLLLGLASHFNLQISVWFLCHSFCCSWYINLNDSPESIITELYRATLSPWTWGLSCPWCTLLK